MKSRIYIMAFMVLGMSVLSGCKFIREPDFQSSELLEQIPDVSPSIAVTKEPSVSVTVEPTKIPSVPITEEPVSIVVDCGAEIDMDAVYDYFYQQDKEMLLEEGYIEEHYSEEGILICDWCEKDGLEMAYYYENQFNRSSLGVYLAGESAYEGVLWYKFYENEISSCMKHLFPEEDLEGCSREEVIAICTPLANACGFGDAQVSVYTIKHEIMNNYAKEAHVDISGYNGSESEWNAKQIGAPENRDMWTEKDDAYILVYQPILNGRLLDSKYYQCVFIYVPERESVVYVETGRSLVVTETLEPVELITKDNALMEVMRLLEIKSTDDIIFKGVSMVYSPRYDQANETLERRIIDPCWRIDYEMNEEIRKKHYGRYYLDDGTIMINAIDGKVNQYARR